MRELFLGVDAGNSKTVALIATATGEIVGRGRAGTGDIYGNGGEAGAVTEVFKAVQAALADAGIEPEDVQAGAFMLAGVDWPEDANLWSSAITGHLPGLREFSIRNDGFSLLGFQKGKRGTSAVAGTGGAVAARNGSREFSLSFWSQHALGAVGLGIEAFRAVVRADLGVEPATELTRALLDHFGADSIRDVLNAFTRREARRSGWERAGLSREIFRVAAAGDGAAQRIIRDQARHFAEYVAAATRRVGIDIAEPFPVVLGGSLVTSRNPVYRDHLIDAIRSQLRCADVQVSAAPAVIGAVTQAMTDHGFPIPDRTRARLLAATHPQELFAT